MADGPENPGLLTQEDLSCLSNELGEEVDATSLRRDRFFGDNSDAINAAYAACDVSFEVVTDGSGREGITSGLDGAFGGGGFPGGAFGDPETQECLTEALGGDVGGALGGQFGGPGGANEDLNAALEECGIEAGNLPGGGQFGGGFGGGGFGDTETQECIQEALGEDIGGAPGGQFGGTGGANEDLNAAFEECGLDIANLPGGGQFGGGGFPSGGLLEPELPDGGDGLPTQIPAVATATPIPVSDLTIEQLSCLSDELEPAELGSVVVATTAGNTSGLSDVALAALTLCGVE